MGAIGARKYVKSRIRDYIIDLYGEHEWALYCDFTIPQKDCYYSKVYYHGFKPYKSPTEWLLKNDLILNTMPFPEIAKRLKISYSSVDKYYKSAMEKLRNDPRARELLFEYLA